VRAAAFLAIAVYGWLALLRVYGGGWRRVATRAAVVGLLYAVAFVVGIAGVLLVTASRM
jgi:hypothetical protein